MFLRLPHRPPDRRNPPRKNGCVPGPLAFQPLLCHGTWTKTGGLTVPPPGRSSRFFLRSSPPALGPAVFRETGTTIFSSCRAGQPSFPSGALPVLELKSGLFLRSSPPARGPEGSRQKQGPARRFLYSGADLGAGREVVRSLTGVQPFGANPVRSLVSGRVADSLVTSSRARPGRMIPNRRIPELTPWPPRSILAHFVNSGGGTCDGQTQTHQRSERSTEIRVSRGRRHRHWCSRTLRRSSSGSEPSSDPGLSHLHAGPARLGPVAGALSSAECGHGVDRGVLDSGVSGAGGVRVRCGPGQRPARPFGSGTQVGRGRL